MRAESDESELSEEQRIEQLESQEQTSRRGLWGLGAAMSVALLVWLVSALIGHFREDPKQALQERLVQLEQRAQQSEQKINELSVLLAKQDEQLANLRISQFTGLSAAVDDKTTLGRVALVLGTQEQDYQGALLSLKSGMRDLANMLPGSRSWLSDYNEALDQALKHSHSRQEQIHQWLEESRTPH